MIAGLFVPRLPVLRPRQTPTCHATQKKEVVPPTPLEKKFMPTVEIMEFDVKVGMSVSVMAFSMVMLYTKKGDPSVYLPLITSVLGYWMPSPTKNVDKKD